MFIRWFFSLFGLCCDHKWFYSGIAEDGGPVHRQCGLCNRPQWRLPASHPHQPNLWQNVPWYCVKPKNLEPRDYRSTLRAFIHETLHNVYPGHFKTYFFQ
jgi:hypothetical protein